MATIFFVQFQPKNNLEKQNNCFRQSFHTDLENATKTATLLLSKANNNDIWNWQTNDFCGYLKLNALSLTFAIYNILNNRGKCQNLN